MNNIISKCISELKSDKPRIDYVLGMLETIVDLNSSKTTVAIPPPMKFDYTTSASQEQVFPVVGEGGFVSPSGLKPVVPPPPSPQLLAMLERNKATLETINVLNAPPK